MNRAVRETSNIQIKHGVGFSLQNEQKQFDKGLAIICSYKTNDAAKRTCARLNMVIDEAGMNKNFMVAMAMRKGNEDRYADYLNNPWQQQRLPFRFWKVTGRDEQDMHTDGDTLKLLANDASLVTNTRNWRCTGRKGKECGVLHNTTEGSCRLCKKPRERRKEKEGERKRQREP